MSQADDQATFEQALAQLDEVVARLEAGDVGLEEAVRLFEQGQALLATCHERLARAQQRIEELTNLDTPPASDDNGAPF